MHQKYTDKILIIDDDPVVRKSIVDYLEDGGFEILEAEDGQQGLSLFHREKPDLVLTDLKMPGLSGLNLLEILAKEAPAIPVIVVSGVGEMKDVIEALRLGAWDYLTKPIPNLAILEHAVGKSLERARLVEQNRIYREQLEIANAALKKSLDILEEDQEAGRSVQMRLLPEQNVRFGEYEFSHCVVPSLYLSGDFVDYFKINEDKMGFYIADVSGHGSSSAFVTVLLKSVIALALTRYQIHNDDAILLPDKLLSLISTEIFSANLGKYLTIVYCVLDWKKHELLYSIGGHYPNPIWRTPKETVFLAEKSFPVGIMKQAHYTVHRLELPETMQLTLFSDGILEIISAPDLPAKEKILADMVTASDGTVNSFLERFNLTTKKGLPDDVTMLILKRIKQV